MSGLVVLRRLPALGRCAGLASLRAYPAHLQRRFGPVGPGKLLVASCGAALSTCWSTSSERGDPARLYPLDTLVHVRFGPPPARRSSPVDPGRRRDPNRHSQPQDTDGIFSGKPNVN